jgi:hypothetical protein
MSLAGGGVVTAGVAGGFVEGIALMKEKIDWVLLIHRLQGRKLIINDDRRLRGGVDCFGR